MSEQRNFRYNSYRLELDECELFLSSPRRLVKGEYNVFRVELNGHGINGIKSMLLAFHSMNENDDWENKLYINNIKGGEPVEVGLTLPSHLEDKISCAIIVEYANPSKKSSYHMIKFKEDGITDIQYKATSEETVKVDKIKTPWRARARIRKNPGAPFLALFFILIAIYTFSTGPFVKDLSTIAYAFAVIGVVLQAASRYLRISIRKEELDNIK